MRTSRITLLLLLFFFLSSTAPSARAETMRIRVQGIGVLEIPQGWVRVDKLDGTVVLQDSVGLTGVRVARVTGLKKNGAPEYLRMRARQLGIPDHIRGIDPELKKKAGADLGSYILGTVKLGGDSVIVPFDPATPNEEHKRASEEGSTLETPEPEPSRYFMVVAYTRGKQVYTLEGWSANLPSGPLELTDIHRSWRLPAEK
ncbi:hypothetical protein KQI63_03580 [bacterium]|nr:hypothetical protein [bacterium]